MAGSLTLLRTCLNHRCTPLKGFKTAFGSPLLRLCSKSLSRSNGSGSVRILSNDSMTASSESQTTPPPIVYSIHGSQFTAKVLSALQQRNIPHYIQVRTYVYI